jgi:hypothetical protein
MTKRAAKKPAAKKPGEKTSKEAEKAELEPARPLKPRRKLLVVLMVVFAIWLGALLTLYFTKVYPLRHPASGPVAGTHS